ncbi:MAG: glycine cleavage system protein GcvH [Firmicutes bacterium]|nr:glycine cleavage system protein GcvH [Bacillota bacterium]
MIDPKELKYTKTHEWVRYEGDAAFVGISDYAQHALGDLVFVNLPEPGDEVEAGEPFGDVESVKAVSDLFSPVSGEVLEINEELLDAPQLINEQPYEAWFIKVGGITGEEEMMDAERYDAFCEEEEGNE